MKQPCARCGGPRDVPAVRWCRNCTRVLHAVICGKPWGHLDDCDPPPTVAGWGMP